MSDSSGVPAGQPADPARALAADPATPPETLAQLARDRPDLRPAILENPGCYEGLAAWIVEQGTGPDPAAADPEPAAAEPDPAERARRSRRRRRAALVVAVLVALVAAVGGGVVLGWTALSELEVRKDSVVPEVVHVAVPEYSTQDGVPMPDVRGLDEAAAREVLADAGLRLEIVETTTREAAGAPGTVISQTPVFGTIDPESVQLVLSTQTVVPDAVGSAADGVIAELGILGAEVEVQRSYAPDASPGNVLAIEPAAGEPLPAKVTLTVAEAPASVFLATLDSVDGRCYSSELTLNGRQFDNALECSGDVEGSETSWLINRVVDRFQATVAIPDTSDPADRARVEVFADGERVAAVDATYGQTADLSADVSDALRLTVRVTLTTPGVDEDSWDSVDVGLGDALLLGSQATMGRAFP